MIEIVSQNKDVNFKKILINFTFFLFLIILFDFAIGNILRHYFFKIKSGEQYNTTFLIEKTTADLIIFGSSRAEHHYYPPIFDSVLKLSSFNGGRDGQGSLVFHYGVFEGMLKRYTPKMIILDVMHGEFGDSLYSYSKLAPLTPYYSTHPEMRNIIKLRSKYENIRLLSSIYPFNSLIMSIISGNRNNHDVSNKYTQGFMPFPLGQVMDKPIGTVVEQDKYPIDSIKINTLQNFMSDCLQNKIKLIIICSPYFERDLGQEYSLSIIYKMAAANNIPFWDFSQESLFLGNPQLFGDSWHLNEKGAKIYSKLVANKILQNEDSLKMSSKLILKNK